VKDRQEKSDSLVTIKTKQKLTYDQAKALAQDRFEEVQKYKILTKDMETKKIDIPDWQAKYPKEGAGSDNLFGIYNVYFNQGQSHKVLSFDNIKQLQLFEFLNSTLETKGVKISIPISGV